MAHRSDYRLQIKYHGSLWIIDQIIDYGYHLKFELAILHINYYSRFGKRKHTFI